MTSTFIASWVKEIIVDPLSKEPLSMDEERGFLLAPYGRKYPIVDGVYDLRLLNNKTTHDQKAWTAGQLEYEKWSRNIAARDGSQNYPGEIEGVRGVYEDIAIEGRCLDVGGHQGRLRQFLAPGQEYVSCDPFLNVFESIEQQHKLLEAYPFLRDPLNFICCDAEFLPFKSACFQTVHMRSVIDHFLNPELALSEAYRVLKSDGALIVGLFVSGGKQGPTETAVTRAKDITKNILTQAGIKKCTDHHIWHPTFRELTDLISSCGFNVSKVHWQKGHNDTVCYIQARKRAGLQRQSASPS